jgi:hypothetical protein
MSISELLAAGHSKSLAMKIVRLVGTDTDRFAELMEHFFGTDVRLSQRAAMAVGWCVDAHPELATPWLTRLVNQLGNPQNHPAIDRNILRMLQVIDVPKRNQGKLVDVCFRFVEKAETPIAVRGFAMTVLYKSVKIEPELARELKLVLEAWLPNASTGEANRAQKLLHALNKQKTN